MLRSFSILSKSGVLLFSTNLQGTITNARPVGSLITALCELSNQSVGAPISYLELSTVAITIVQSEDPPLRIILFHDPSYYRALAKCVAIELLRAFTARFDTHSLNMNDSSVFRRFSSVIGPSIRAASFPLLNGLIERFRGNIPCAVVFCGKDAIFTYPTTADLLSVGANLQSLEFTLQDLADIISDEPYELVVESPSVFSHLMLFGSATVVIQIRNEFHSQTVVDELYETFRMLSLCFRTAECLMA